MEQLRIALVDPPRKETFHYPVFPNLGLLYLITSLRERLGDKCQLLWLDGNQNMTEHLDALENFRPHIYGISFTYFTRILAYRTIKRVRKEFGSLPILCGGAMPTAAPNQVLESCPADICILGEGESALCELVEYFLEDKSRLDDIPGLVSRDSLGNLHKTAKRRPVPDLDVIAFPAWDLVDFKRFPGWHMHRGYPQTLLQVSRGCPYDCNFCSNPVWKYNKPWLRYRSPGNIAKEVELLYSTGAREIYLAADEINFSQSWAMEVCHVLAGLGHDDLYFNCNIRPDVMSDKLAKAFKKANIWCAHIGIESGNQRVLDGVGKKVNLEEIVQFLPYHERARLEVSSVL
jgi:anaerobic magnesium-protoporphyrin IX monomethyl ester cyclase